MAREIRLNAFDMNCVSHLSAGLWTHPRDRGHTYKDLSYWLELAKLLERGKFDGIFLADVLGVYDVYGGNANAALRQCAQIPVNDPVLVVPAMATVTEHLGFGVTCTLSFEPPYQFARRMSTLDHLTGGRIGWNIVTGYLDSAARGAGFSNQTSHDMRYDMADEYMEVVYKLWEGSWEDDAVVRDRANGIFAAPEKVHRIRHEGKYYRLDAIHLCEPSPQRTPLLYQAGASARGRELAAKHAECVFVTGSKRIVKSNVADIRQRAAAHGRGRSEILMFAGLSVIVGPTEAAARTKLEEYRRYIKPEAALALLSGWTGIDFSQYSLDDPLTYVKNDAVNSIVEALTCKSNRKWTLRELVEYGALGGPAPTIVGSPAHVADELESWIEETDVDGFNLAYIVTPESFIDFVELVVPELQRRSIYKQEYSPGTLREKLFGTPRLRDYHPAACYRYNGPAGS
jgi:FMN-dependent oxidoreductase (nitrilotriacetate monooxygenase family)